MYTLEKQPLLVATIDNVNPIHNVCALRHHIIKEQLFLSRVVPYRLSLQLLAGGCLSSTVITTITLVDRFVKPF